MNSPKVSGEADELLPCPFCGGRPQRITLGAGDGPGNEGGDIIACTRCQASSHVEFGRKENLVNRWNGRAGEQWQPIETLNYWYTNHMRTVLANWTSRGVCETYWDEDEEFDTRPKGWVSPRAGWRSPGDMCIPVNQDAVTHWMEKPAPPRQLGEKER